MTIETTGTKIAYTGDAINKDFSFNFKTFNTASIKVYEDGVASLALLTVTLNLDQIASPGGSVNVNPAPAVAVRVTVTREEPLTQTKDYITGGKFPAESHEQGLDILTQISQQQQEELTRKVGVGINDDGTTIFTLPPFVPRRALVWDAVTKQLVTSANDPDDNSTAAAQAAAAAALVSENAAAVSAAAALVSEGLTDADSIQTGLNAIVTAADAISTAADVVLTNNDVTSTNADVLLTAADVLSTAADVISTAANKVATNADVLLTAADVISTAADVVSSAANAAAALASETQAGIYAASAGAAAGIITVFPEASYLFNNDYTATLGISSYVEGTTYQCRLITKNSSGAVTMNFDGLGAKPVKLRNSINSDPVIGQMQTDYVAKFIYFTGIFYFINPAFPAIVLQARATLVQTISSAVTLNFNFAAIDTINVYDPVNYKYLPTLPGYYRVDAIVTLDNLVVGDSIWAFIIIDSITKAQINVIANGTTETMSVTWIQFFNGVNNDVWIRAWNTTRATSTLSNLGSETQFNVTRIGD